MEEKYELKVANKDIRIYLGDGILKFQKYDYMTISAGESFTDKGLLVANIFNAMAITIDPDYKNLMGRIKWKAEVSITSKKEQKIFYKLGLKKILDCIDDHNLDRIEDAFEFGTIKTFESDYEEKEKEVIIADRDLRLYLGEMLLLLQKFDQIYLSFSEQYLSTVKQIVKIYNTMGLVIEDKYLDKKSGKIMFDLKKIEIFNKSNGRREIKNRYKIGLTKIPDLFMYTDPDRAIELPPLSEPLD